MKATGPQHDSLSAFIREEALRLGFQKVGIAAAEALQSDGIRLREWLSRGYHGSMHWMERNAEKRTDPSLVLPSVRSIVCVAMNYWTKAQHSGDPAAGKISRYAWGDDYHEIVGERLEQLLASIQSRSAGVEGKVYVDTGPVMEKAWAERSGLGWRGKHTNVITQEFGSWIFLGEVLLSVPLEYDAPAEDHCGTCTLCIEACPTGAIPEPYVVDSNRCISYLTIEHRGEIAADLGEKFDRWIYGCDICQDVCPWNHRFSSETPIAEFGQREINRAPTLASVTELTDAEFSRQYRNSPVKRTKRAGLARNARAALSRGQSHSST